MADDLSSQGLFLQTIGYFHGDFEEKYEAAKQGSLIKSSKGKIILSEGQNYEQALEDLQGFERIWVIFHMHKVKNWKRKVQPPHSEKKRSVFATRSPHRPNPIGMSCVKLQSVKGRTLFIQEHDLLNETPILDIKPYLSYSDSFPEAGMGWLEEEGEIRNYSIQMAEECGKEMEALKSQQGIDLYKSIFPRLSFYPFPKSFNRIKALNQEGSFEIAYKNFRLFFTLDEDSKSVYIFEIKKLT
ncbi:Uncharacterized protein AB751O23_AA_00590 [Chlamydiales bacterium SCGC AB-751-O23]|nr:Uncharacterized protein AB751O23_AA_00590 [Chlamydiales bacterium SCGC AB-751-O23]